MRFNDYQEKAYATAIYPDSANVIYPALGLAGEAGEVANKVKKLVRGDTISLNRDEMIGELGDVLWYLAVLAEDLGISLNVVAERNLKKLADRKARGVLQGSGDNR